jgi:recombination protein RecA
MLKVIGSEKGKVWNPIQGKYVDSVIGSKVRAKLDKCKVSSSLKNEIDFFLISGSGVDNSRTVIELGISTGVIKKKGAWFSWQGPEGEIRSQGLPAFINAVEDHIDSIFASVRPYLSDPALREESAEEEVVDDLDDDEDLNSMLEDLGM